VNGVTSAFYPISSEQLLVSLGGVIQEPDPTGDTGFRISFNQIIFAIAPAAGVSCFIVCYGNLLDIGSPANNTVTTEKLVDGSVTPIKLSTGGPWWLTNGNVGIGTTNPGQLLELYGSNKLIKINSATDNSSIAIGQWDIANNRIESVNRPLYITTYTGNINLGPSNSQVLSITQSSNVGIGTANPTAKLDVRGPAYFVGSNTGRSTTIDTSVYIKGELGGWAEGYYFRGSSNTYLGGFGIYGHNDTTTYFWIGPSFSSPSLVIASNGNVGIGTDSIAEKLHIHTANDGLSAIRISGTANLQTPYNIRQGIVGVSNAGFSIWDVNAAATRFAIDSAGNIGVGTGNPGTKLHVEGTGQFVAASSSAATTTAAIYANTPLQTVSAFFGRVTSVSGLAGDQYSTSIRFNGSDVAWGDISYYPNQGGRGHFRFSLAGSSVETFPNAKIGVGSLYSAGSIGIGTTNPQRPLHVTGSGIGLGADADIRQGSGIEGGSSYARLQLYNPATGTTTLENLGAFAVDIRNNGSSRIYIKSDGNVGIGTTNPLSALHVVGADGQIYQQATRGSGRTWRFGTSGTNAENFELLDVTGGQRAFLYGSPTGGYSGWEFLYNGNVGIKLNGSGNVGIGTTNPTAALHVIGSTQSSAGIKTLEQVRATGWWNTPTGSSYNGLAVEMGVSSGNGYVLCYNRDNGNWGTLNIQGSGGSTNIQLPSTGNTISVTGSLLVDGSVSAAGTAGFYSTTFVNNARNPIWRFANADAYGLSYFQGGAGVSPAGGGDTIGFHFGTATAAASLLQLNNGHGAVVNGNFGVTGNVGIGTTNPTTILHVKGGANQYALFQRGAKSLIVNANWSDNNAWAQIAPVASDSMGLSLSSRDTSPEYLFIANSGNVGIGTTTPLQKFDVRGKFLLAADATTSTHITQVPYTINNGTLSWEGSAGQLFSITNNLTSGSIFSVNDVSGLPSIDVDADGTIKLAPYGGTVVLKQVTETVANTFTTTLAPSSGTLTVDISLGTVILGDLNAPVITWAFTNVPTANSRATTITLIIDGDTAHTYGEACSVNGSAITGGVKWVGGNAPTPTVHFDIITFTIVRDSAGTIIVFGSGNTNLFT
jgi:hypothetical protein